MEIMCDRSPSKPLFNECPWTRIVHDDIITTVSKSVLQWLEVVIAVDNDQEANADHIEMVQDEFKRTCEGCIITAQNIYDKYIDLMGKCVTRIEELVSILGVDLFEENQNKDMPLSKNYNWLKTRLQELEIIYEKKQKEARELEGKYELLAKKLGRSFRTLPDVMSLLSEEKIKQTVESLEQRAVLKDNEFKTKIAEIRSIIQDYGLQLDEAQKAKFLELSDESFGITSEAIDSLNEIYQCVVIKQHEIETRINGLKEQLEKLWNSLHFSASEKISFLQSAEIPQRELEERLSDEIARLEAFRDHNLENLIEECKATLTVLWDQCHCGSSIRNDFPEIYTNDYSQAVLDHFNEEIKKWEEFYAQNYEIIITLNTYNKILKEAEELRINRDPRSFYANRGGKMAEELKKLGILKSRINKTEEKLLKLSNYFSQKHGEPFLSFDRTIEALIKTNVSLKKYVTKDTVDSIKAPRTPRLYTPKSSPFTPTPQKGTGKKKAITPRSHQKRYSKKEMPKFRLLEAKTNSPKKCWRPSVMSLKSAKDSDDESWTSDFTDFEKEIKIKNIPRSSSILK